MVSVSMRQAPASGGATQGPTMMADNTPITATPARLPLFWLRLSPSRRDCRAPSAARENRVRTLR